MAPLSTPIRVALTLAAFGVGILVSVVAATAAVAARESGLAGVRRCHVFAPYPNIVVTSARNMTCLAAARELRRYRGSITRVFRTPGGFVCRRVSGGRLGGEWRCVRQTRAFRFEFGD